MYGYWKFNFAILLIEKWLVKSSAYDFTGSLFPRCNVSVKSSCILTFYMSGIIIFLRTIIGHWISKKPSVVRKLRNFVN